MQSLSSRTRKLKFWLNLTKAYIVRYKYPFLITVFSILIVIYGMSKLWPKIARSNLVSVGYVGTYTIENIPTEVLSLATQPLITVDDAGRPQPALASHWTVSDDGKTYVVFLKDNLRWHDDTQVDAKDITIAIQNVTVTALNNKAIEFQLPNPISSFPVALDKPVFKAKTFYGTGEFRITEIKKSQETIQKISLVPKNKKLPRVEIKFYQTEKQLQDAIKIGDVKYASVANAKVFETWNNLEVQKELGANEVVTIFFNSDNADPELVPKELRQALTYAINRSSFDGEKALSSISPNSWAYNQDVRRYDYNTGRAKELLSKSQTPDPKIKLSVLGSYMDLAESIKKDWNDLGVDVEIIEEKSVPHKFQALLTSYQIPPDPDQYGLWHSTQKETNLTKFNDPKIDKLLEDARNIQDEQLRKPLYEDFQRFLVEDAPVALLYHPYKYRVVFKNIKGLVDKLPQN